MRTNILTEDFFYPSSFFHLNFNFLKRPLGFHFSTFSLDLIGVWKYKKKIVAWKEIFHFSRFPKWSSLWSVGRLGVISHRYELSYLCFLSHLYSVDASVTWRFFSTFYPKEKPLEELLSLLLICSFLCLMNIYGAVAGHQVSILQTSIRKWFLPLEASKWKRGKRWWMLRWNTAQRRVWSIEKGWWGLESKTASSKRKYLNWVLKDSW